VKLGRVPGPPHGRGVGARALRAVAVKTPALMVLGLAVTGCGTADSPGGDSLTLGYFPNITHAPALIGVERGTFAEALGEDFDFATQTFNAGPDAINALFSGEIDATFIGPNPAINGWVESDGTALRIIAGAASGGGGLVVREGIEEPDDLEGATLSTPQLGNTQDVALRYWATGQGWEFDTEGGGDIAIVPQDNSQIIDAFAAGEIDGAWVPEPHLSRLVEEGGHLLIDEAEEWPETGGEFVTTHLIVNADYLEDSPEAVGRLLQAHLQTVDWMDDHPDGAKESANAHFAELSGEPIAAEVLDASWENLTFTVDPIAESLRGSAAHAEAVGLLDPVDLDGIYALAPLNDLLQAEGRDPVSGLDAEEDR
jgi:NitT/TauT family transport system substrate-binding protein